jgi:hypothetical protein
MPHQSRGVRVLSPSFTFPAKILRCRDHAFRLSRIEDAVSEQRQVLKAHGAGATEDW